MTLRRVIGEYLHPASIKRRLLEALSLGDPPEKIAMGMTVGVIIGIFPTFYVGLILAALGARVFKYNLAAAIAGSAVATPLTSPFIFVASAALGSRITGVDISTILEQIRGEQIWAAAVDAVLAYLAGNAMICALVALPIYALTKRAVVEYRKRHGAIA